MPIRFVTRTVAAALAASAVLSTAALSRAEPVAAAHAPVQLAATGVSRADGDDVACAPLLRHAFVPIRGGAPESLCRYRGNVIVVVNTASQCGYTPQYEGLEALYRKYRSRGLVVIGFPSNDFAGQEPGSNAQIAEFCRTVYGVEFPMYEKASVVGVSANPLYAELAVAARASPRWNFHKYVVDRSGRRVASFASDVRPDDREFVRLVERLLAESPAKPAS
jgi:glutathione peroxidase